MPDNALPCIRFICSPRFITYPIYKVSVQVRPFVNMGKCGMEHEHRNIAMQAQWVTKTTYVNT